MDEHEAKTYPPHDCREVLHTHYHNQADATYSTCGVCGRITAFAWKHDPNDGYLHTVLHGVKVKVLLDD